MAVPVQTGHIVPLRSILQSKKVILIRKNWQCYVLVIRTINHYNK